MKRLLACLFLCLSCAPLATGQSQSEMNREAAEDAAKADKELNAVYKKLLPTLDEEAANLLKIAQRAWVAYRDAEANSAADQMRGGSAAPLLYYGTITRLTEQRTELLKEHLNIDGEPEPEQEQSAPDGAKTKAQAAKLFFDAYKSHQRKAAQAVAADKALDKLVWSKDAGDNPTLKLMGDSHIYYEGGSIALTMKKNEAGRWFISDVTLFAD